VAPANIHADGVFFLVIHVRVFKGRIKIAIFFGFLPISGEPESNKS
jgi:hypothetical protein